MKKGINAFTIVELLIVIVVIAILATITIVAYNGIQTRAENTKTIKVVEAYARAMALYAVDNGTYPSTSGWPCLGTYEGSTICGKIVAGTPGCGYSSSTLSNAGFDAIIAPYLGAKPSGSTQRMSCNGETYMGAYMNATDTNPKNATIRYYLKGNENCPTPAGLLSSSRLQADQTTSCTVAMPTLP